MSEANAYSAAMLQRMERRYSKDAVDMPHSEWIELNTKLKGRPFSFDRFPFQRAITDDMHPNMDVKKISQVGLTEVQIRKVLSFLRRNRGMSAIFTLPDEKLFKKISQSRVMPIVKENAVFNTEEDEDAVRSMSTMQFGMSWLYMTASGEGDATSTSADAVFNDELDLTDQAMVALFNSRLQGSLIRINQRFSTPSYAGFGIDAGYNISDQREYMVRCDACNHWQVPEFNRRFVRIPGLPDEVMDLSEIDDSMIDMIDLPNSYVCCEQCERPLDLASTNREWVANFPSRTQGRGYWVRPFSTSHLGVDYIVDQLLKYKRRDYMRGWHNTVLGEAYTDGNARLDQDAIDRCFTSAIKIPEISPDAPVFVGIDVGQVCHVVLGTGTSVQNAHAFSFLAMPVGEVLEYLKAIQARYRLIQGCVDRHPYQPTAESFRDGTKGKVWPVEYRGTAELNLKEEEQYGQVNRTMFLDQVARQIRNGNLKMSGYGHQKGLIIEHLRDLVRDEKPEEPAKFIKLTGNDHFYHALGFMLCAIKMADAIRGTSDEIRTEVAVSRIILPSGSKSMGLFRPASHGVL